MVIKSKNRFIRYKTRLHNELVKIKICIKHFVNHPFAFIKGLYILLIKGPDAFYRKLHRIEKKYKNVKKTRYYKSLILFYYLKRLLLLLKKIFLISYIFRIIFAILYFSIYSLFFISYKLFAYILSIFPKKEIAINNTDLNGISFIIPTWNKKKLVKQCVNALIEIINQERGDIQIEIIIVENGSTDKTYETLSSIKCSYLNIIRLENNIGFAKGINLGASKSKYNYVYLMNNDMIPQNGMLSSLIKHAQNLIKDAIPFCGINSQIFFYDAKKRREESGKNYLRPDFGFIAVSHYVNETVLEEPSITAYPGGGSSLINKELFQLLGGFDASIFLPLYDEDLDFGFTAWRYGFPTFFLPDSHVIHYHRSSSTKLHKDPSYFMYKNFLTLILKQYSSGTLIVHHLFAYPIKIIADKKFISYAFENSKIIHKILLRKIQFLKYKEKYNDVELLDFPKFEFKYYEK